MHQQLQTLTFRTLPAQEPQFRISSAAVRIASLMHGEQIRRIITGKQTLLTGSYRTSPAVADIATISIGGNDIGFYNILTACVLRVGGYWAGDCDTEVAKAYDLLASPDLPADIASVLTQIIHTNGNEAFRIYMTGYVTFFNELTPLCDNSSFRLYNPHYDNSGKERGQPFLTRALRKQLNDVVIALNAMLIHVVESIDTCYTKSPKVVFIDPNPAYKGHRWCEEGVYEPENDRLDTWLFLSSSPDNNLPEHPLGAMESYNQEQSQQLSGPSFSLPDPKTCRSALIHRSSVLGNSWYGMSSVSEGCTVAV